MGGGVIFKGREANQYNDIHAAKYWRDKNGVKHKVTPADGDVNSATVKRQTKSPQEIEAARRREKVRAKRRRISESYRRSMERP
jgi:hypothetical protein